MLLIAKFRINVFFIYVRFIYGKNWVGDIQSFFLQNLHFRKIGSGALSGKILDLELLMKISLGSLFFLFLVPVGGSNPAGQYSNTFPNLAGQS